MAERERYTVGRVGRLPKAGIERQLVQQAIAELRQAEASYDVALGLADGSVGKRTCLDEAKRRVELASRMLGEVTR